MGFKFMGNPYIFVCELVIFDVLCGFAFLDWFFGCGFAFLDVGLVIQLPCVTLFVWIWVWLCNTNYYV